MQSAADLVASILVDHILPKHGVPALNPSTQDLFNFKQQL